ncbi:hypothetical protein ACVINX_004647 [Bradyrhizobium diazoefficiens]
MVRTTGAQGTALPFSWGIFFQGTTSGVYCRSVSGENTSAGSGDSDVRRRCARIHNRRYIERAPNQTAADRSSFSPERRHGSHSCPCAAVYGGKERRSRLQSILPGRDISPPHLRTAAVHLPSVKSIVRSTASPPAPLCGELALFFDIGYSTIPDTTGAPSLPSRGTRARSCTPTFLYGAIAKWRPCLRGSGAHSCCC